MTGPFGRGRPSRQPPPPLPGIYRLRDITTNLVRYAGETDNLARRRNEHRRSGRFNPASQVFEWKAASPTATWRQRRVAERRHIARHSPPDNKRGGGGRPPKDRG